MEIELPLLPALLLALRQAIGGGIGRQADAYQAEQEGTGDGDGGEHTDRDAKTQCERKPADGAGPVVEQNAAGHHGTEVGVEDSGKGALETGHDARACTE